MSRLDKTVFISYRRVDVAWAQAIFQSLQGSGFDVFVDLHGLASGSYESVILDNIRTRAHFLVLLTPTALERCADPKDLFRREIVTALKARRNVVPIMLGGFSFGAAGVIQQLGDALAPLREYNSIIVPDGYFEQAMDRLRQFLAVSLDDVKHPADGPSLNPPLDPLTCLVARINMTTLLPIAVPPRSTAYILPMSNLTPTLGFMEIGNGSAEFSQWPSLEQTNGLPPEFALRCTLSNALDKALVNVKLIFQVHYRIPRPDGGVVATDPIDHTSYPNAVIPIIHPYSSFEFIIANRSKSRAAEIALSSQAIIQIAGESAPRRILITKPEVSIIDMLASNVLSPTRIPW